MQRWAWRYHPEFKVEVLVDGATPPEGFRVMAATQASPAFRNYQLLTRGEAHTVVCHQLQKPDGANWIPAVPLDTVQQFRFWVFIPFDAPAPALNFFTTGARRYGRPVLYTSNLDAAGAIDTGLSGGVVSLTTNPAAGDAEHASISTPHLNTSVTPGSFTQIEAGRILPGSSVTFSTSAPIDGSATSAALDLQGEPEGPYEIRLNGGSPESEVVLLEHQSLHTRAQGFIDIYRDAWLTPAQPRTYQLNFASA